MSNASFNLHEAKELLHYIVKTNRANRELGIDTRISAELIGDSGLGKTSAVLQVAEELEIPYVKLNMAQIEEVGDLCGFPIKKFTIQKDDEIKVVSQESLLPFYKRGWMPTDTPPIMSYAIPEWIAGKGESGILVLDDYSRGDIRLLQATMELIDRGQYISWKLPKDWHIVLTSNPDDGEFIVNTTDKAQKGRYLSADIHYDKDVWAEWAESNHVDSRCINFLLMNDDAVRDGSENNKGSDPRSWTKFFYAIGHLKDFKSKEALQRIEQIGSMAVGSELAATFATFINGDMDKIPDPAKLIFAKDIRKAMEDLRPIVRQDGQYRSDIGATIGTRVANYVSSLINKKKQMPQGATRKDIMENVKELIVTEILGVDVSFALAHTLMQRHQQIFAPVIGDQRLRKFITGI